MEPFPHLALHSNFHRISSDESGDVNSSRLAHAMTSRFVTKSLGKRLAQTRADGGGIPVFSLFVIVRVEVDVVENDAVSRRQVDPQPAGFCRQEENEDLFVLIELVNQSLPNENKGE